MADKIKSEITKIDLNAASIIKNYYESDDYKNRVE